LFTNPNFLILDEPTNDLDLPTLAVLENFLSEFQGCVLIVSHDRYFMDRLVDHLFVFEGDGIVRDFPGNYTQYRLAQKNQHQSQAPSKSPPAGEASDTPSSNRLNNVAAAEAITKASPTGGGLEGAAVAVPKRKLSFKEKREFELLEADIARLEKEKKALAEKMSGGNLPYNQLAEATEKVTAITNQLEEKELRWLELSENV
jgi:ATP-binding cassette subfamily F protein uup